MRRYGRIARRSSVHRPPFVDLPVALLQASNVSRAGSPCALRSATTSDESDSAHSDPYFPDGTPDQT